MLLYNLLDATINNNSTFKMSEEFIEGTKRDARIRLKSELDKLLETALDPAQLQAETAHDDGSVGTATTMNLSGSKFNFKKQFETYEKLFGDFLSDQQTALNWSKIEPLPENMIINYDSLKKVDIFEEIRSMLNQLVVVKLNGGLGTSMGCYGPKSIINVRNNLTFLDLTVQQIENLNKKYNVNVPLVLMNSFNTDADTKSVISKYKAFNVNIIPFMQSCCPKINIESLLPFAKDCNVQKSTDFWYPPGHGDFYRCFKESGHLNHFLRKENRKYCFVSNIDNLGAVVDLNILNFLIRSHVTDRPIEFLMEVTNKTPADVKGGTIITYENRLRLLEIAQVPKEFVEEFKSVKKFKVFNTNNLWISLEAIDRVINNNQLDLEIIVNKKTLENGMNSIQLETAIGAGIKCFDNCIGVNVSRNRFLPVKKTSDLLLVMSNLYYLDNGRLKLNPRRMFPSPPVIKLGDLNFSKVRDFLKRFETIPDILELDHLTVSGDVTFGRSVVLKGTVIVIANHGERIDIPSGAVLENKIVSGNLRILDH